MGRVQGVRVFSFLIALTLLQACGDAGSSFSRSQQDIDNTETRYQVLESSPSFSPLIGEISCQSEKGIISSSFYEGYAEVKSEEDGEVQVEHVRIVIDRKSRLAIASIEARGGFYSHYKRTNVYYVENGVLRIEKFGSIQIDSFGDFILNRVNGVRPARLTPRGSGSIFVSSDFGYQMICNGRLAD